MTSLAGRVYVALVAVEVVLCGVVYLGVRADLAAEARAETVAGLRRTAEVMRALIPDQSFDDRLADSLGTIAGARVTLIRPDGSVAGDSDVDPRRLPQVENHGERPEVRAALGGEVGVAERASETVSRGLLYVAVPAPGGVIRLASLAPDIEIVAADARGLIFGAMLVAALVLIPVSRLVAGTFERRLERTEEALAGMAGGDLGLRTGLRGADSVGSIGESIDRVAASFESRLAGARDEAEDLRALSDGIPDGLAYVDAEGVIRLANPAFETLAGRRVPAGTRAGTLFRSPELIGALEEARAGHEVERELPLGERTLHLSARVHRGGALLWFRDLTDIRQLQGVRRDFVANVSHELKTPLTSIVGFAEAIADGGMPGEEAGEFAQRILANTARMRRLVDDLLDLSLIESGTWSPSPEPVDMAATAHEVWEELAPERRHGAALQIADPASATVRADPEAVRQILRNLLDNACRYAPDGERVEVEIRPDGAFVRTGVRDFGPGIPTAHRERVFERFYRIDPGRSRDRGGTGLGLAIVKHLVAGHGGEVGIASEVSRGTTVWFTLPGSPDSG